MRGSNHRSAAIAAAAVGVSRDPRRSGKNSWSRRVALHAVDTQAQARSARPRRLRARDDAPLHAVRLVTAITVAVVALLATTTALLLGFGMNLLYLTWRAT